MAPATWFVMASEATPSRKPYRPGSGDLDGFAALAMTGLAVRMRLMAAIPLPA
jgi:hypothetical protein